MELDLGCSCVLSGAVFENDYVPWLRGEMKMRLELGQSGVLTFYILLWWSGRSLHCVG